MATGQPHDEQRVAAVSAVLSPYPWRSFTPGLLARWVLAAGDRHGLADLLAHVAGSAVGAWAAPEPAAPDDPRVPALVGFLESHRWHGLRLSTVCRHLLAVQHEVG
ncbi:MAG: hypothetical protein ACXVWU_02750 [Nocardioides sp.]